MGHGKAQLGNIVASQPHRSTTESIGFHENGRSLSIPTEIDASIPYTESFARVTSSNAFHVSPTMSDHAPSLDLLLSFHDNIIADFALQDNTVTAFASRKTLHGPSSGKLNIA